MKIDKLKLYNFRNYSNENIKFGKNMNIFIGENAQGKTNILESIVLLALTKSHRNGINPNIIMFNKKKTKITGNVIKNGLSNTLEFEQDEENKRLFINNNRIIKVSDYISNLNVIVFTPDDLDIVKGSPTVRRNLLNIELSQISNKYLNTLNEYNKILKLRNEYLKILYTNSIADKNYLDILTDKLIDKAIIIYKMRNDYINNINNYISNIYNKISILSDLNIKYIPNIDIDNYDDNYLKELLNKEMKSNYTKDLKYGMTTIGPHRDDFMFLLDDKDVKYFGSQGQQKLSILSFKLSEINIFKEYTQSMPILLLDDIFSEFDIKKRNKLLKYIDSLDIQSVITTTDIKNINKRYLNDSYVYKVFNGNIERL